MNSVVNTPHTEAARYHALDGLRACMMLLGLVLHAAASYTYQAFAAWGYQDPQTFFLCDLLLFYIHLFRMPVFFVLAGLFGALLCERRGLREFLRNRALRVGVPLLLGWAATYHWTMGGFLAANAAKGAVPLPEVHLGIVTNPMNPGSILMHLWFLYYLLLFYAAVPVVLWLWQRVPEALRARLAARFRRVLQSPARALHLAVPTALSLLPMEAGLLETQASLTPHPKILAAYGIFFAVGWCLYPNRDLLKELQHGAGKTLAWTFPLYLAAGFAVMHLLPLGEVHNPVAQVASAATGAVMVWLTFFGSTGLFFRHCSHPSPKARYLADSSYWLYLSHLPVTVWLAAWFSPLPLPGFLKFPLNLLCTFAITLLTYGLFVRSTVVGELLNGRRYPRGLPRG